VLEARAVVKRFPGVLALSDVGLALLPGEVHGLVGENGAGKSTLIKLMTGAYRPDGGELRHRGTAVSYGSHARPRTTASARSTRRSTWCRS